MMKARLIIPAYNEEENIALFYEEARKYLVYDDIEFDMLFVNDGSKDNTLEAIKNIEVKDIPVKYLSLSRNFGKEPAMHAGLVNSQDKDFIIIIDCDLQQPPALIPEMIQYYREGYKIIYTKSKSRDGEPRLRRLFANLFYKIYNVYTERPLINGAKDYQLMDKQVVDAFIRIKDNNRFIKGIFSWVGFKRKSIEFDFIPRQHGKTSWSFYSLLKYAFNGMNQFSTILLVLPVLSFVLGFMVLIVDIFLYIFDFYALTTFIITLHLSFIILALSIFSYVIIYLLYQNRKQVLQRPIYLIEEASEDLQVE
ncbi:MAG: glycosyltransferase family 2 protein [Candidatus Izemoplasmatales bacterium]|uniref:Glycosyltransferase family 2 protein n=1 Tax=Hujiaoplasma nucleasis TaxID=2725268 RepID=A0A7L6N2U6_9MOLU|nr:glycosyltransferase family 2 protein [Hujiaoplasma nucleasis]QLY40483.1 glycosyltransferase family 2 protein [Hujiaoplasma nucleasis]